MIISIMAILAAVSVVQAQVTGLFDTGVDDSGNPLAIGEVDQHYVLRQAPIGSGFTEAYAIVGHPAWVTPTADSHWIGPTESSVTDPEGLYIYKLLFDIGNTVPAYLRVSGKWATDNSAEIFLNRVSTGITKGETGFMDLEPFAIESGFVPGINKLEFVVLNYPGSGNPTGLLVSETAHVIPAPGAFALTGIGASLVGWMRRRKMIS